MYKFLLIAISIIFLWSCHSVQSKKEIDKREELLNQLRSIKGKGILFGHQDDLAYGISWKYVEGESDVKRVAGDYPALYGWELGGLGIGHKVNLDSVPFDVMRKYAVKVYQQGGVNTFSWHAYSPVNNVGSWDTKAKVVEHILPNGSHNIEFNRMLDKVAAFLNSIRLSNDDKVPFIFRPWHEMDGEWFWWGSNQCTPEDYQSLFRYTVDYLRNEAGVDQMLVAYSPDCRFNSKETYLTWFPGDDYVDIMGMDNYHDLKMEGNLQDAIDKLHIVIDAANSKGKISALSETGIENVTDTTWYSTKLGVVLSDSLIKQNLSYTMVWRNDPKVHFFFPYPGHPGESYAKDFLNQPHVWLLDEFNGFKKNQRTK